MRYVYNLFTSTFFLMFIDRLALMEDLIFNKINNLWLEEEKKWRKKKVEKKNSFAIQSHYKAISKKGENWKWENIWCYCMEIFMYCHKLLWIFHVENLHIILIFFLILIFKVSFFTENLNSIKLCNKIININFHKHFSNSNVAEKLAGKFMAFRTIEMFIDWCLL